MAGSDIEAEGGICRSRSTPESSVPCPARVGDTLFFSYLAVHDSDVNVSNEARTALLVQMRDPVDPQSLATHQSRGQGMILRGIGPTDNRRARDDSYFPYDLMTTRLNASA